MASIDRTAYPRFRGQFTDAELAANFTLSEDENAFVRRYAHGEVGRFSLAIGLKTRQFLGYFPALEDAPDQIRRHVANVLGFDEETALVDGIARPATVHRYREAIRKHLGSRPFSHGGREVVIRTVHRAAQVMSDPADLISASVEALVKEGIELPAFSNLDRLIGNLRHSIHEEIYRQIDAALIGAQRRVLDAMLDHTAEHHLNRFSRLKETPGPPNLKHLQLWIDRLAELGAIVDPRPLLGEIPHTKIRQFAAEAKALETGDLRDVCQPGRRHTRQAGATDADEEFGRNVRQVLIEQGGIETLGAQFHAVTAYHNDNYLPLLWPIHSGGRSTLFRLLGLLTLESASADTRLLDALEIVLQHQPSRFVSELRDKLEELARTVDAGFPDNSALRIDQDGTPHLIRQVAQPLPQGLQAFEQAIRERMPERHLLDVLKHVQHWSSFTHHFGPLSGSDPKLEDATKRYRKYSIYPLP